MTEGRRPASEDRRPPSYEIVANVSEGRSPKLLERYADALRNSPGIALLDVHADVDHDRSVFTYVASGDADGAGSALRAATRRLAEEAIATIDLLTPQKSGEGRGVHPRIGALDVVPVVPIGDDATISGAMAIATGIAASLGELGLSVHCYGAIARSEDRRSLFALRRGEFEGLDLRQCTEAGAPDFGPRNPHPSAGAVAVGVRPPMVAWNIELVDASATNGGRGESVAVSAAALDAARAIARTIRASSGGSDAIPGLQALGLPLSSRGTAQVSINLHDAFSAAARGETLHALRAKIATLATARGFTLGDSEIVGLVHERLLRAGGDPAALQIRGGWERAVLALREESR